MKNYMKPSISFQFFNLVSDVSGGCTISVNKAAYECRVELPDNPGVYIFSNDDCTFQADPEDFGICYHGPEDTSRLLGS